MISRGELLIKMGIGMNIFKAIFGARSETPSKTISKDASIGQILLNRSYRTLIKNNAEAKKAALSVFWHGQTQLIRSADGAFIFASTANIHIPSRLKTFADMYYEETVVVSQDVAHLTEELTRGIDDQILKIETIYSIADAIVGEYNL